TYGATGACNVTADTAGVLAAIAAVPGTGGEVYFPAGTYCVNQSLQVFNRPMAFRGEGQRTSNIGCDAGGPFNAGGIEFWSAPLWLGARDQTLAVRSLSLLRHDGVTGAAIFGYWGAIPTPMGHGNGGGITTTIEDVHIGWDPAAAATAYWEYGILLL